MKLILDCLILIVYLILIVINYKKKKIISISLIFNMMWFILSLFLIVFSLPTHSIVLLYILIINISFTIPGIFFKYDKKDTNINDTRILSFKKYQIFIIVLNILGLLYLAYSFKFTIFDFTSLAKLSSKMNSISHLRYSEELDIPIISRLINAIIYAYLSFEGFYSVKVKKLQITNLILIFLQTIITNTKATLVFALAFYFSGIIVALILYKIYIDKKTLVKGFCSFIGIFLFFVFINYFRHNFNFTFKEEMSKILNSYIVGPFSAYNEWLVNLYKPSFELGINTFSAPYKFLGIIPQLHGDFIYIDGIYTNVFTVFKHLNNDFGILIPIMLFFLLGLLSAIFELHLYKGNTKYISYIIILSSFLLISFFSSIFRYNVNILACLLVIIFFSNIKIIH